MTPTPSPTTFAPTANPGQVWLEHVFHYIPNDDAAYLFIALFSLFTLTILVQTAAMYGGPYMYVVVLGGVIEVLGYGTRVLVTKNYSVGTLIATSLFLLVAPILLAFVNYLVAGWLLIAIEKKVRVLFCHVSPNHVANLFLASDVVCMLLQALGGAMLADGVQTSLANAIVIAGLVVQLTFLSAFSWIIYKMRYQNEFPYNQVLSLYPLFVALFLTTACIWLRTVYRLASFATIAATSITDPGYIASSQWMFFTFDSALITFAMCAYAVYPLNKYLQTNLDHPQWKQELEDVARKSKPEKDEDKPSELAKSSSKDVSELKANDEEEELDDAKGISELAKV
jgi:hypothetical protein